MLNDIFIIGSFTNARTIREVEAVKVRQRAKGFWQGATEQV